MLNDKESRLNEGRARYGSPIKNAACPICRKEQGAKLEEHLKSGHGMDDTDARVVAKDTEGK